ncbi:MAG: hypothetical protein FWG90_08720 [Oscillospiraceae bacterium]|nr:hypothetical protein [Oscillospiraceae bacterium]
MKNVKITAVLTALLLLAGGCSRAPEFVIPEDPDVRNALWNMTMDEVIFCESKEPDERLDNALIYKNVRLEKIPPADITYNFYNIDLVNTDGSERLLSSVTYSFNGMRRLNQRQLHNTYIEILDEYSKKYGTPISDARVTELSDNGTVERTVLYEPVEKIYDTTFTFGGTALYTADWTNEFETTNIRLRFVYDERGPVMEVLYEYFEHNNDI